MRDFWAAQGGLCLQGLRTALPLTRDGATVSCRRRLWTDLMQRTFGIDVLALLGSEQRMGASCGSHHRNRPRRYNGFMITRGIREFVSRDWEAARENKEIYWGERIGRLGATEGLRVADELRRQMLRRDPGWPDVETRQADLRFHASLAERFHRAGATRRR